jgi:flagellar hook assembly protein FlgD
MMRPYFIGAMEAEAPVTKVSDASAELERALQLRVLPNPFRSSLLVELNLQQPSTVAVTVYDAGGNRIQKVFNGQRGAGRQQFSIDGSKWSNGSYFCEIVVNQQRLVRKLVLQQ